MARKRKNDISNTPFDDFFRRILQNRKIVEELLKVLVNKSWVKDLDFSTLRSVLVRLLSLNKSKNKDKFKELPHNLFKFIKIKNIDEQKEFFRI